MKLTPGEKTVADKTMSSTKNEKWVKSAAKGYLMKLLTENKIPADMKPKEVFEAFCKDRPEFASFGHDKLFSGRLRALRIKVLEGKDRATIAAAALENDRRIYPRPHQDGFGLPYWPDSEAKALLSDDIDNGKHVTMTKLQLWSSRPQHADCYPFEIFVKHVHQEIKTRKFHVCCNDKAKKLIPQLVLGNMPGN